MGRSRRVISAVSAIVAAGAMVFLFTNGAEGLGLPQAAEESARAVSDTVASRLESARVPAASYVVVDGDSVVSGSRGAAEGEAVDIDTPFVVGGISQAFTATAVLQLADRGQIDLDAPVTEYLDWFTTADAAPITIRQLLESTSGLPSDAAASYPDGEPLAAAVVGASAVSTSAAPGARSQTSNLGYATLGAVVEQASGLAFADYLAEHVFSPLGMTHSTADVPVAKVDGLADGATPFFGAAISRTTPSTPAAAPSALVVSTAADLATFARTLLGGGTSPSGVRLLSQAAVAEMLPADGRPFAFEGADGVFELRTRATDTPAYQADLALLTSEDKAIVVLTDRGGWPQFSAGPYRAGLAELKGGEPSGVAAGYTFFYAAAAVVAIALVVAMCFGIARLLRWARRLPADIAAKGSFRARWLPIVVDFGAAAAIWFGAFYGLIPLIAGFRVDAGLLVRVVPDLASLLFMTVAYLGLRGLARLVIAVVSGVRPPDAEEAAAKAATGRRAAV